MYFFILLFVKHTHICTVHTLCLTAYDEIWEYLVYLFEEFVYFDEAYRQLFMNIYIARMSIEIQKC